MPQHRFRPEDTSPEVWKLYLELMRAVPSEERLRQAFELTEALRRISEAGLGDGPQSRLKLAERWIGRDLAERLYGSE
jgi:hypothetical protein